MNGFGSDNSDVDMCLLVRHTEMDQRNEAVVHLEQMLKCLRHCGESFTVMWCHIAEHRLIIKLALHSPYYFMFEFLCIVTVYYVKNQQDATSAVLFISHCKITLRVSDAFCVHHQEY